MQTVNKKSEGFAQQHGYFEMTAKFPAGKGAWPAFWLQSRNRLPRRTETFVEIDVVEWYGGDPRGHHASLHLWPANRPQEGELAKHVYTHGWYDLQKAGLLTAGRWEGFHSYGVEVRPDWVIFYLDRKELHRFPSVPEFSLPLFMMVDLAILEKEEPQAVSPMDMIVKEVAAYLPQEPYAAPTTVATVPSD
jgi:beta-glucanase (GH16 family)